jgi:hypothetical protein
MIAPTLYGSVVNIFLKMWVGARMQQTVELSSATGCSWPVCGLAADWLSSCSSKVTRSKRSMPTVLC